jgi:hypothetical protein
MTRTDIHLNAMLRHLGAAKIPAAFQALSP